MRVLITNDDGINAPGLAVAEALATEIAGEGGEVWCVAPATEQSGVGHCISYAHPTLLRQVGDRRFAVEGSPADCVLAAIYDVMPEAPDLVISGVNRGNNAAENAVYSGTVGAAMEGALQGLRAVALSQYYGKRNLSLDDPFEAARRHGAQVLHRLLDDALWDAADYRLFYNVNFPPCPASEVSGFEVTAQGWRPGTDHRVEPHVSPSGRRFLYVTGGSQTTSTGAGTDAEACLAGRVSITPMRCDLTAHDALDTVRERLG